VKGEKNRISNRWVEETEKKTLFGEKKGNYGGRKKTKVQAISEKDSRGKLKHLGERVRGKASWEEGRASLEGKSRKKILCKMIKPSRKKGGTLRFKKKIVTPRKRKKANHQEKEVNGGGGFCSRGPILRGNLLVGGEKNDQRAVEVIFLKEGIGENTFQCRTEEKKTFEKSNWGGFLL